MLRLFMLFQSNCDTGFIAIIWRHGVSVINQVPFPRIPGGRVPRTPGVEYLFSMNPGGSVSFPRFPGGKALCSLTYEILVLFHPCVLINSQPNSSRTISDVLGGKKDSSEDVCRCQ